SAVSQYLSGKRGYRIEFEDEAKTSIALLAQDLIDKKEVNVMERICRICRQIREVESEYDTPASERCGL
ncbi:MAG: transcriptional regulator, partial [Methanomicrobiales archaeon HGW-Methanomicrobiales-5]